MQSGEGAGREPVAAASESVKTTSGGLGVDARRAEWCRLRRRSRHGRWPDRRHERSRRRRRQYGCSLHRAAWPAARQEHAAALNPRVRAIAPHSSGSHDLSICPSTTKPVLIMHFDSDSLISYSCGTQARDRWIAQNGCSAASPTVQPVTSGSCEYHQGCRPGGRVAMCTFTVPAGARNETAPGHAWSGGSKQGTGASFAIPETQSAAELAWGFFRQYAF